MANKRETLLLNNRFLVSFGLLLLSFAKVSNLQDSCELETIQEGGSNWYPEVLPKQKTKAETLVLEKGLVKKGVADFLSTLYVGMPVENGIIMVLNRGRVGRAYYFEHGYVTKWEMSPLDALGKEALFEKVEITHSGLREMVVP